MSYFGNHTWYARRSDDVPDFADLSQENKRDWLGAVRQWRVTNNDALLDHDQRYLESITSPGEANGQTNEQTAGPVESGGSVRSQRTTDAESADGRRGQADAAGTPVDSTSGATDAGPVAYVNGQAVNNAAKPVAVTNKRRTFNKPTTGPKKFSKRAPQTGRPISVEKLQQLAVRK